MPAITDNTQSLLRLTMTPELGPRRIGALVEAFGSATGALAANPAELERVQGIGAKTAAKVARGLRDSLRLAEAELELATQAGVAIIGLTDPDYPRLLRQIPDPPPVLYVRGRLLPGDADRYPVGIVGSRACTTYGLEQSERFGSVLGSAGLTIVSGGARGIDSAAHRGALQAGGRTIAVLGCGLAHVYPPENTQLFDRIVDGRGAIVSELPMQTHPAPENFPGRNRIISGLSLGVVVIEAARGSGALITARTAGEDQGREVFAVPGRVDSHASEGSLQLLRAGGALIALGPGDVIDALESPARHHFHETHADRYADPTPRTESGLWIEADAAPSHGGAGTDQAGVGATPLESRVLAALAEPRTPDQLVEMLEADAGAIRSAITMLEIRGVARRRGVLVEQANPAPSGDV